MFTNSVIQTRDRDEFGPQPFSSADCGLSGAWMITRRFWRMTEPTSVLLLRAIAHKRAPANPAAVMIASIM